MTVGELFINLGVKGADKTLSAISNTQKGLKETASTSLEMKAALVGAMYALQRLFAASGNAGQGLMNFNALTGQSAQELQRWQYAGRQVGVTAEDMAGSFKTVQNAMTSMLMGEGAPKGLAMLAERVGFDARRARDTYYVLSQMQKFALSAPADVGNAVLRSFGASDSVIAAMRRNAFRPEMLAKAPTYSDKEIAALSRADTAWSNLGAHIERAVGKFNAKHGTQLVNDITKLTDKVLKLADALVILSEKLKVFEAIGWAFDQASGIVGDFTGWLNGKRSFWGEDLDEKGNVKGDRSATGATLGNTFDFFKTWATRKHDYADPYASIRDLKPIWDSSYRQPNAPSLLAPSGLRPASEIAKPRMNAPMPVTQAPTQNIDVKQNLYFQHDGKDSKKTSDAVKKANQDAFRQFNQGQVS